MGVVTDDTGAILPGVTVTASSAALIRDQVAVTGSQGAYASPALPTGEYAITFSLPARSPSRRRAAASRRHTLKVGVEAYRERLGAVARRALSEWGSGCSVVLTFERCGAYAGRPGRGRHGTGWAESYDSVLQLVTS